MTLPTPTLSRYSPQHAKTGHTAALAASGLTALLLPLVLSTGTASADVGVPAPVTQTASTATSSEVARTVTTRTTPIARVADLREATQLKISGPTTQTAGRKTVAAGQLFAGAPVQGASVELQIQRLDGGWRTITRAATDEHGVATMNYRLGTTTRVRTYFPGDTVNKPTASETPEISVQAPPAPVQTLGQRAVIEAAKHYGARYRYGSTGPSTFDCSGLTGYVYRQLGVNLPRTSSQQQRAVRQVPVSDMRTGDLIFTWTGGRVTHVGIYDSSTGMMWAATHGGDIVRPQALYSRNITVGRVGCPDRPGPSGPVHLGGRARRASRAVKTPSGGVGSSVRRASVSSGQPTGGKNHGRSRHYLAHHRLLHLAHPDHDRCHPDRRRPDPQPGADRWQHASLLLTHHPHVEGPAHPSGAFVMWDWAERTSVDGHSGSNVAHRVSGLTPSSSTRPLEPAHCSVLSWRERGSSVRGSRARSDRRGPSVGDRAGSPVRPVRAAAVRR